MEGIEEAPAAPAGPAMQAEPAMQAQVMHGPCHQGMCQIQSLLASVCVMLRANDVQELVQAVDNLSLVSSEMEESDRELTGTVCSLCSTSNALRWWLVGEVATASRQRVCDNCYWMCLDLAAMDTETPSALAAALMAQLATTAHVELAHSGHLNAATEVRVVSIETLLVVKELAQRFGQELKLPTLEDVMQNVPRLAPGLTGLTSEAGPLSDMVVITRAQLLAFLADIHPQEQKLRLHNLGYQGSLWNSPLEHAEALFDQTKHGKYPQIGPKTRTLLVANNAMDQLAKQLNKSPLDIMGSAASALYTLQQQELQLALQELAQDVAAGLAAAPPSTGTAASVMASTEHKRSADAADLCQGQTNLRAVKQAVAERKGSQPGRTGRTGSGGAPHSGKVVARSGLHLLNSFILANKCHPAVGKQQVSWDIHNQAVVLLGYPGTISSLHMDPAGAAAHLIAIDHKELHNKQGQLLPTEQIHTVVMASWLCLQPDLHSWGRLVIVLQQLNRAKKKQAEKRQQSAHQQRHNWVPVRSLQTKHQQESKQHEEQQQEEQQKEEQQQQEEQQEEQHQQTNTMQQEEAAFAEAVVLQAGSGGQGQQLQPGALHSYHLATQGMLTGLKLLPEDLEWVVEQVGSDEQGNPRVLLLQQCAGDTMLVEPGWMHLVVNHKPNVQVSFEVVHVHALPRIMLMQRQLRCRLGANQDDYLQLGEMVLDNLQRWYNYCSHQAS